MYAVPTSCNAMSQLTWVVTAVFLRLTRSISHRIPRLSWCPVYALALPVQGDAVRYCAGGDRADLADRRLILLVDLHVQLAS
jgi:hypothetical protein